jgi:hypothetical protein
MRRSPALRRIIPAIAVGALVLAACGSDDDTGESADDTTAPADDTTAPADTTAGSADGAVDCSATIDEGVLTIATGEPAFYPWVIDDAPETGEGFEAAVALAVAAEMGYDGDAVTWDPNHVRRGDPAGSEELRHEPPAVLDHRGTPREHRLLAPLLHQQPGDRCSRGLRCRRRHVDRRPQGREVRRAGRHHQPGVHHRRDPAQPGTVRLRRQRRREGGTRSQPDRRSRLRPADRVVRVRRRDRGQHRRSGSSRPTPAGPPTSSVSCSRRAARSRHASTRRSPR